VVSTTESAPIIANSLLRKGSTYSARGAATFVTETLNTVKQMITQNAKSTILLRADSAFYNSKTVKAARKAGAHVSITTRMNSLVRKMVDTIPENAWIPIKYANALYEAETNQWISEAEVALIPFTAFGSKKEEDQAVGNLVVRRILQNDPGKKLGQLALFDTYRFHALFTTDTSLDAVTADKTHRQHAVIESVNADLKASALAHLPSGKFSVNMVWLILACVAFNLTRAGGTLAGKGSSKAVTATIRRKLINVPARISFSARKYVLHLPKNWPWESCWLTLFDQGCYSTQQVVP
jgi:Transposase DDE domain group 1